MKEKKILQKIESNRRKRNLFLEKLEAMGEASPEAIKRISDEIDQDMFQLSRTINKMCFTIKPFI